MDTGQLSCCEWGGPRHRFSEVGLIEVIRGYKRGGKIEVKQSFRLNLNSTSMFWQLKGLLPERWSRPFWRPPLLSQANKACRGHPYSLTIVILSFIFYYFILLLEKSYSKRLDHSVTENSKLVFKKYNLDHSRSNFQYADFIERPEVVTTKDLIFISLFLSNNIIKLYNYVI